MTARRSPMASPLRMLRAPSALGRQQFPLGSWVATLKTACSVLQEVLAVGLFGNVVALFCAVCYGWANPFANNTDPQALAGLMAWTVASCTFVTMVASCPVMAFLLRDKTVNRTTSANSIQSIWRLSLVIVRISWGTLVIGPLLVGGVAILLHHGGVPLLKYNIHSSLLAIAVMLSCMRLMANGLAFRRRNQQLYAKTRSASIQPTNAAHHDSPPIASGSTTLMAVVPARGGQAAETATTPPSQAPSPSPTHRSRWKTLWMVFFINFPSGFASLLAVQFITVARNVRFDSTESFMLFTTSTAVIKVVVPLLSKLLIDRQKVSHPRDAFVMIAAPALHMEIQVRMAMLRAQRSTSIVAASAMVNLCEIGVRAIAVTIDLAKIRRAKSQMERERKALVSKAATPDDHNLASRVEKLETDFETWRRRHLRVCASEVLADMTAEFCGIGLVAIYAVVLHQNGSFDLPRSTATTQKEVFHQQAVSWLTQMGFEIITDLIGVLIELKLGIPLLETIAEDQGNHMRWSMTVLMALASGLCLSSLIVYRQDD